MVGQTMARGIDMARQLLTGTLFRTALASAVALAFGIGAAQATSIAGLTYIGSDSLPTGFAFQGTNVGGLSGIDYNPATGRYYAISDDRSQFNPARFYELSIDLSGGQLAPGGVSVQSVTTILGQAGQALPALSVDPESIRLDRATGTLYWTSEGDAAQNPALPPFVREMNADGTFVRTLPAPAPFVPTQPPSVGIRNNLAFESLTISPDGKTLFTATENALLQDGPAASTTTGSPSRILSFDLAGGTAGAQYIYDVDPVAAETIPPGQFATNGLVELLALDDGRFIAVERSFSTGVGNSIKLYLADLTGATDVSGLPAVDGQPYVPVHKTLLYDLAALGITLDNIEGITFGPTLPDGAPSLILVSDNNFSATQFTQFIAFRVEVPEPAGAAPVLLGLIVWRVMRRRRA